MGLSLCETGELVKARPGGGGDTDDWGRENSAGLKKIFFCLSSPFIPNVCIFQTFLVMLYPIANSPEGVA